MKFRPKHDAITPYETLAFNKFRLDFDSLKLKPRKRKKFEFTPLPTLEGNLVLLKAQGQAH